VSSIRPENWFESCLVTLGARSNCSGGIEGVKKQGLRRDNAPKRFKGASRSHDYPTYR
jgi:hypothetical protein